MPFNNEDCSCQSYGQGDIQSLNGFVRSESGGSSPYSVCHNGNVVWFS